MSTEEMYRQASLIAEIAGDAKAALRWQRARCDALMAGQRAKSASLAAILAAESGSDALHAALAQARAQCDALLRTNAELQSRIARREAAVPVDPGTGLAHAALLPAIFASAFERACTRALPMCIGLLCVAEGQVPPVLKDGEAMNALLRQVTEVLAAQGDVAQPAMRVGPAAVAFHVLDGGPGHAAVVCAGLLERVNAVAGPPLPWRCRSADAVAHGSLDACVRALLGEPG